MAQIINKIEINTARSNGERLVLNLLSDENVPGIAFYSLLQKNRIKKLIGEVDFLYVSKRGFLCIEVKGGLVGREDGNWFSIDKAGKKHDIQDPFKQAIEGQNALKDYYEDVYGKNSKETKFLFGYAVIFPECDFSVKGNNIINEVVYDKKWASAGFAAYLDAVYDYWEKLVLQRHGAVKQRLTEADIKNAQNLLCADFYAVPSMSLELQAAEQHIHKLTEEQKEILHFMDYNSRVIVLGAAGTGKSVLALQLARKYAAKNKKVLYLCYNSNMAKYANASLTDHQNIKVSTFHALLMKLMNDNTLYDMSVPDISRRFFEQGLENVEKYSVIIIDEGQDLLNFDAFSVINELLEGGLSEGIWSIFYDPNQNIFSPDEDRDTTLKMLQDNYHAVTLPLLINCRNTKPIATRTAVVSCTKPAEVLKVEGPRVVTRSYSDNKDFLKLFTKELASLINSEGYSSEDIVILSRYKMENSQLSGKTEICNRTIVERKDVDKLPNNCLSYYTVQSFKGLERNIVFYIDVDGFSSVRDKRYNYIAMSRALLRLYVFYDKSKEKEYQDTKDEGSEVLQKAE